MTGLRCPRTLWLQVHDKESVPKHGAMAEVIMGYGSTVGKFSHNLFPGAISLDRKMSVPDHVAASVEAMKEGKVVLECSFMHEDTYSRIDILKPSEDKEGFWDLLEVKATTNPDPSYYKDLAYQYYVAEKMGIKIDKTCLVYLDNTYTREGDIDVNKLFKIEECTELVKELAEEVPLDLLKIRTILAEPTPPAVKIDENILNMEDEEIEAYCPHIWEPGSIFNLVRMKGRDKVELWQHGVRKISDIKHPEQLTQAQSRQHFSEISGKAYLARPELKNFIDNIKFPAVFCDFETFQAPVPIYDSMRAYEQVPFQFVVAIVPHPGAEVETHYFIADEHGPDERLQVIEKLKSLTKRTGSFIAYNSSFESTVLKRCAAAYPKYQKWVDEMIEKTIDLYAPFRQFDYYHPSQQGSASLKPISASIFPTDPYSGLKIKNGIQATQAYLRLKHDSPPAAEVKEIKKNLNLYCGQDTQGMVDLAAAMEVLAAIPEYQRKFGMSSSCEMNEVIHENPDLIFRATKSKKEPVVTGVAI